MVDIDDIKERLVKFHRHNEVPPTTLDEFHEWNIRFALEKFRAKKSNEEPVTFFNFLRHGQSLSIMESGYRDHREKASVFKMVRAVCMEPAMGVDMLSVINEVWIASVKTVKEVRRYGSVSQTPGREDGLMVTTYRRDGEVKMTRWVVKLKANPANNRVLARDDIEGAELKTMSGQGFGFFHEERDVDEAEAEAEKGKPQ